MMQLSPFKWASFNFFGFFCAYGVMLPFLPVWLKHYGYSAEIIGLIASVGYVFRFIGGVLASQRVKHVDHLIPTARSLTWLNLAVIPFIFLFADNIWILFPLLMLFHAFNAGAMPIADSIASVWQQQVGLDYGKARLFGSVAFVVGSLSCGYLVGFLGETSIIFIFAGFMLFLSLGQSLKPTVALQQSSDDHNANSPSYWQIFKEPTACRMLIVVSLILGSHAAYYTYSTLYWSSLGISTEMISLLWGVAVVAEIGMFFFAKRFLSNVRIHYLMMVAATVTILRWLMLANISEAGWFIPEQCLHSFSFAMTHFAMIRYISSQEVEKIAKLQGLYFGLSNCAVVAVLTFVSGLLYQESPTSMFLLMAAIIVPIYFLVPRKLPHKPITQH